MPVTDRGHLEVQPGRRQLRPHLVRLEGRHAAHDLLWCHVDDREVLADQDIAVIAGADAVEDRLGRARRDYRVEADREAWLGGLEDLGRRLR